ncbi:TORTIFOLIA1-like protein 3 [Chenopodium quinoa]|uniref:TORTIFOLIA1-like protein 3 n=1 Tax=Chenopodium quinoa TaxID=63459 RepID=UPI000B77E002|nr:TORTIFOLIA1-like protein 3 [Chenopodium quinoa]
MAPKQSPATMSRDLRHRVLTCMTKLSDRDTLPQAVSELESIIPTLTTETFSLFINSLSSTSAADRSAVRVSSLKLLASLSSFHGISLSPHLPKLISAVVRRLRDPDSAVRSSAAVTTASFARHVSNSLSSIFRPLADSLSSEQEFGAQSAAAMCLSAAIEASPAPETSQLMKVLPKWMKLVKCDGFKAKSSLILLMKSSIRVCEIGNCNLLRDLVNCFVEFLKSEDWSARKAAADALKEIAMVERENLSEMKGSCLKIIESRKFDKVKAVRESMNQALEVWKEVPDVFDDGSPPPNSQESSKENASDGRYPGRSKISSAVDSNNTPQTSRKRFPLRKSSPSDSALKTTARNRGTPDVIGKRSSPPVFRKLDCKKSSDVNTDATDHYGSSGTPAYGENSVGDDEGVLRRADLRQSKHDTKRGLFSKNSGSRVMPCPEDDSEATVTVSNTATDVCKHHTDVCKDHKDFEDLSLIRKQLVQIESQQSSLMDVLQKFIGSSQDGMRTLETRVHGLEMALDDISYDLAMSTARMSSAEATRSSSCCLLPGPDFLSSKFWRRPDGRCSTSRFSFGGTTPSVSAMRNMADKRPGNTIGLENQRFSLRGPGGVIMNPLADIHDDSRRATEVSTSRVLRSVRNVA